MWWMEYELAISGNNNGVLSIGPKTKLIPFFYTFSLLLDKSRHDSQNQVIFLEKKHSFYKRKPFPKSIFHLIPA